MLIVDIVTIFRDSLNFASCTVIYIPSSLVYKPLHVEPAMIKKNHALEEGISAKSNDLHPQKCLQQTRVQSNTDVSWYLIVEDVSRGSCYKDLQRR